MINTILGRSWAANEKDKKTRNREKRGFKRLFMGRV